jgi:L-2-hydroxyglutarate oxidase LhgO
MEHLYNDAISNNVKIICNSHIASGEIKNGYINLSTCQGDIKCNIFINATGLNATHLMNSFQNYPKEKIPKTYYSKGNYFKLNS